MKLTLKSWIVVGLMALTFIVAFKWITSKTKIAGLQSFAAAA
jgi:hypothetical protein